MTGYSRIPLSGQQVFSVWKEKKSFPKKLYKQISRDLKIPYHSVIGTDKRLDKYLNTPNKMKYRASKALQEAADLAKKFIASGGLTAPVPVLPVTKKVKLTEVEKIEKNEQELKAPEKEPTFPGLPADFNEYEELGYALEQFKTAVETFIEKKISAVRDRNAELEATIDTQNILLKKARHNNWGVALLKKFGG